MPPFPPLKFAYKIKKWKIMFLVYLKIYGFNKASWKSQPTTLKLKWVLFSIFDYESGFFGWSPPFSSLIFLFFTFVHSLHMHIRTQHHSSICLPCCFSVSGKPTVWHFNSLLIPGDQTKKLRDLIAAYLLCRCKYLHVLKFRGVSPSLTNKSIYTAYSRL